MSTLRLVLYSKPGCHLCEGLQEKLEQIQSFKLELDVRDITTRDDWFQAYQYEIPVLFLVESEGRGVRGEGCEEGEGDKGGEGDRGDSGELTSSPSPSSLSPPPPTPSPTPYTLTPIPRPSPRASIAQLERMLQKYLVGDRRE